MLPTPSSLLLIVITGKQPLWAWIVYAGNPSLPTSRVCVTRHKPIGHKDNNPATGGGEDSGDFDISGDEASQY